MMFSSVTKIGLLRRLSGDLAIDFTYKQFSLQATCRYRNYVRHCVRLCLLRNINKTKSLSCKSSITNFNLQCHRLYSSTQELTSVQFEKISDETLESLTEYFDELIEQAAHLPDADVSYGDGVLTIKFGDPYGTYVINRQTPNKQIWLSSPKSGPKRYDYIDNKWIYKHDGKTLHELLNEEVPAIVRSPVSFDKCSFSGREKQTVSR